MRDSAAVRIYSALLRLLPRAVRERDGEEIAATLRLQLDSVASRRRRRVLRRAYLGLLRAIVLEWLDRLRGEHAARLIPERRSRPMDGARRHLRQGLRSLARTPSFTVSAVLLLGLGVGSVTTIFTVVDHVVLRPLPYPEAERLFEVENGSHSGPVFAELQRFRSVEAWAAAHVGQANLTGAGQPQAIKQARISRDFFEVFGARTALGRVPSAEEFDTGEGAVLSAGTWRRLFGGERDIVGRAIVIDGAPVTVLGVLSDAFQPPEALTGAAVDVWRPIDPTAAWLERRTVWILSVAGRFRADATLALVAEEADALAAQRARDFPEHYVDRRGTVDLPVVPLREATVGEVRPRLKLLLGAVGLLLLVACTNVAHLFMARSLGRTRELAVRRALGAGMASITLQLLLESLLVGLGGALLGIVLAFGGVRAFTLLTPLELPRLAALAVDVRIMLFALAVSAATALLFGLLPALRLARRDVASALQSRGRALTEGVAAHRARGALVSLEVALSIVLVTQAGLLVRSFVQLHSQELGFRTDGIVTLPLRPERSENTAAWVARSEAIRASLASVQGVQAVTYGYTMPLEYTGGGRCCWSMGVKTPGVESEQHVMIHPIADGYFEMFALRFVAGGGWDRAAEREAPFPAVITEPVANALFGSARAALGRELNIGEQTARVSGVVEANRHYGPDQEPFASVYVPAMHVPFTPDRVHMAVLAPRAGEKLHEQLRDAVWRAEPNLPVPVVRTLGQWAGEATAVTRFVSQLFATFGVVALLLMAGGLYGTLLYSVGRRRRELGIRLALGATPLRVERRVLSQAIVTVAIGCGLGLFGAWGFARLLKSLLYGVDTADPITFAGALALLFAVAVFASWIPARRAARTDPTEALRAE